MTIQQRMTMKASDIEALEFECHACHAVIAIRLEKFEKPPIRCSQCDARGQWLVPGQGPYSGIINLGETLRSLARDNGEHFEFRFALRSPN